MAIANEDPLMVKAQKLFPHREYLDHAAVINARVGYVKAIWHLRKSEKWGNLYA